MAIVEVEDLSAGYGNGFVIHDLAFSLEAGEFVTILGKNGSGKSTLIKALLGLLKNVAGRAEVAGQDISRLNSRQIAKIVAYVPQMFDATFEFTVLEIIHMGRYAHQGRFERPRPEDERAIEEVMRSARVSPLKDKKLAHLSGGERQRVFIARALAQDTPLLFLDEPSSHLDISYQLDVYRILQRLQEEKGKTILCTEHNINLAIPFSNRIMFLKDGRIHSLGPPRDLITGESIRDVFAADVDIRENVHSRLPEISLIPKTD